MKNAILLFLSFCFTVLIFAPMFSGFENILQSASSVLLYLSMVTATGMLLVIFLKKSN